MIDQDAVDALLQAGADMAQTLQDIIGDEEEGACPHWQCEVDAWESAYKRVTEHD